MKALADYVHRKGLKFGIYSDAGTGTCQNRPGGRGYEFQDARQYAAWGVDYLKYDWCNHGTQDSKASYSMMRDALAKAGRPIVFSLCEWGSTKPWLWARDVGNLWRSTGDIIDQWDGKEKWGGIGVVQILDLMDGIESYAGPGHWNDPDMLEVGNGGMTATEYRAHFSMWCMLAAPLMAGNDIRSMPPKSATILTNKEVIAIDQDPLGHAAERVRRDGDTEIWSRPLADGGRAVALLNRGPAETKITVAWPEIGYPERVGASVRDLWAHKDLGQSKGTFLRHGAEPRRGHRADRAVTSGPCGQADSLPTLAHSGQAGLVADVPGEGLGQLVSALDAAEAHDLRLQRIVTVGRLRRVRVAGRSLARFHSGDVHVVGGREHQRIFTGRHLVIEERKLTVRPAPCIVDERGHGPMIAMPVNRPVREDDVRLQGFQNEPERVIVRGVHDGFAVHLTRERGGCVQNPAGLSRFRGSQRAALAGRGACTALFPAIEIQQRDLGGPDPHSAPPFRRIRIPDRRDGRRRRQCAVARADRWRR